MGRRAEISAEVRGADCGGPNLKDENGSPGGGLAWFKKVVYGQKSEKTAVLMKSRVAVAVRRGRSRSGQTDAGGWSRGNGS